MDLFLYHVNIFRFMEKQADRRDVKIFQLLAMDIPHQCLGESSTVASQCRIEEARKR
jgi:hypothetical protein